jgi:hypothetical protein
MIRGTAALGRGAANRLGEAAVAFADTRAPPPIEWIR